MHVKMVQFVLINFAAIKPNLLALATLYMAVSLSYYCTIVHHCTPRMMSGGNIGSC